MPHLNIMANIDTSEKGDFRKKMAQRWIQAGNKMQAPRKHQDATKQNLL
jgi:hypothetical protein